MFPKRRLDERAETDDSLTMPTYEAHEDVFFFSGPCSIEDTRGFDERVRSQKSQCQ